MVTVFLNPSCTRPSKLISEKPNERPLAAREHPGPQHQQKNTPHRSLAEPIQPHMSKSKRAYGVLGLGFLAALPEMFTGNGRRILSVLGSFLMKPGYAAGPSPQPPWGLVLKML